MQYGLQLYSIRDAINADYRQALKIVAEQGYRSVETFQTEIPAEEIADRCKELGLTVSGTHTGAAALSDDVLGKTIADHKRLGCNLLIIPAYPVSTAENVNALIELINRVNPILAAEGITLAFHNHGVEFLPNQDGQIPYEELLNRTDIQMELDIYWAYHAGEDPTDLMERLGSRLVAIHLKDGTADGRDFPLGMGTAPVKASLEKAIAMGVPVIVESETQTPDGPTETKICMDYLKNL